MSNDQLPRAQASHNVRIKAASGWRARDTCVLEISMGNRQHYGDNLASIVAWADRNFSRVIFSCGDTLHRHNLAAAGASPDDAHRVALQMGDTWLAENAATLQSMAAETQIVRWDEWLADPAFEPLAIEVRRYFAEDAGFRQAVLADVSAFLDRAMEAAPWDQRTSKMSQSVDYLLEEAAVYILSARKFRPVRCYPADELDTMIYLARQDVPTQIRGMTEAIYGRLVLNRRVS